MDNIVKGSSVEAMCLKVVQRINENFKRGYKENENWFTDIAVNHMHNVFRENKVYSDDIINQRYSYYTYKRIVKRSFVTIQVSNYRVVTLKVNYVDGGPSERLAGICNLAFKKAIDDIRIGRESAFCIEDNFEYKNFEKVGVPIHANYSDITPIASTEFDFDMYLKEMHNQTQRITSIQF